MRTRTWNRARSSQRRLPPLRALTGRLGDWLVTVGWAKFALVAILLLAAAGMTSNIFYGEGPAIVVDRALPADGVKVDRYLK